VTTPTESYDSYRIDAPSDILFLCDHATNIVPPFVGDLGLPAEDMERHIAWDPGALGVAKVLADAFDASVISSRFSRLVIDPNRGADDPTLIMQLYDGSIIPGNAGISPQSARARRTRLYDPYHAAITQKLNAMEQAGQTPKIISLYSFTKIISLHSFTPQLRNKPPRPWEIGILYAHDTRLAAPLLASLGDEKDLTIGDNQPYTGALQGDCMDQHGLSRNLPHVLIELRNDLIAGEQGQHHWAARLMPHLRQALGAID